MDYSKVEKSFSIWAKGLKLTVQSEYQGEEVRSVDIFDKQNQKWQLWLVPVNHDEQCVIHYWNYKEISRHRKVSNSKLLHELTEIGTNIINGTAPKAKLP